jgi:hypothetical protein
VSIGEVLEVMPGLDVGLPARILYLLKHLVVSEDFLSSIFTLNFTV